VQERGQVGYGFPDRAEPTGAGGPRCEGAQPVWGILLDVEAAGLLSIGYRWQQVAGFWHRLSYRVGHVFGL
jgi:hypothetical protein